ncbi:MAG TPA: TetR/AcrR family transcriptional regulator [Gemmatimonadales bacterium]|nr:TetR/AcrR family transcriptional regulator [Gemmatimonadales bacterium]
MEIEEGTASGFATGESAPTAEARQRERLAPEERRDKLLDAALAVFSELGFERATLNDVADRVGATKGCLYHYFESKEKLLLELVRERKGAHLADYEEFVNSTGGSREQRIEALVRRMWQGLQEPGQIELAILTLNQVARVPELRRYLVEEVISQKQQTLERALATAGSRDGGAGETNAAEVTAMAAVIPCMILGVAICEHLLRGGESGGLTPEQLGEAVTRVLLHGVS